jgi:hypothetical protein
MTDSGRPAGRLDGQEDGESAVSFNQRIVDQPQPEIAGSAVILGEVHVGAVWSGPSPWYAPAPASSSATVSVTGPSWTASRPGSPVP